MCFTLISFPFKRGGWLEQYPGQTTDELIALERQYRTDSSARAFEQALDQKVERVGKEGLTEQVLGCTNKHNMLCRQHHL